MNSHSTESDWSRLLRIARSMIQQVNAATPIKAISAIEKLKPEFVRQANSELAIRPAFAAVAASASERAKEILRAVD